MLNNFDRRGFCWSLHGGTEQEDKEIDPKTNVERQVNFEDTDKRVGRCSIFLEPSLDPISRALARSVRGRSGGLAKARPNLSESAELQTDLARTSPKLGYTAVW
ncbi:hypothetical protein B0H14DRAFT_2612056 [Mycena olivaceomarginata]|nr:hypothetical protein B0H14DRAFT_2612056 [Mycena olivaceomarginata]